MHALIDDSISDWMSAVLMLAGEDRGCSVVVEGHGIVDCSQNLDGMQGFPAFEINVQGLGQEIQEVGTIRLNSLTASRNSAHEHSFQLVVGRCDFDLSCAASLSSQVQHVLRNAAARHVCSPRTQVLAGVRLRTAAASPS